MASAGAVAVFTVTTEAGPASLIIAGALLLVAAVMGRQIKEIGLADGTLTLAEIEDRIRNADSPDDALNLASAATTVAPEVQRDTEIRELSAAAYERVINDRLASVFGPGAVRHSRGAYDRGTDIEVTLDGKKAGIVTKFGDPTTHIGPRRMREIVETLLRGRTDLDAIVIVSNMHEPALSTLGAARDRAQEDGKNFQYVRWNGDINTPQLQTVIEDQLRN
ncbi:hypothetical protein AB0F20_25710 [Streptomyces goshikiensis]|uniref:hypothetical protein n=1 Tax=Streptomyces goshikiensis TaxID=1942 RepID=UPI0033FAC781